MASRLFSSSGISKRRDIFLLLIPVATTSTKDLHATAGRQASGQEMLKNAGMCYCIFLPRKSRVLIKLYNFRSVVMGSATANSVNSFMSRFPCNNSGAL